MVTDDASEEAPEPAIVHAVGRLTRREKAILWATATVCLVAGIWIGLYMVPDAALDVPKEYHEGRAGGYWDAAYAPIPTFLVPGTVLLLVFGAWATWRQIAPSVVGDSA